MADLDPIIQERLKIQFTPIVLLAAGEKTAGFVSDGAGEFYESFVEKHWRFCRKHDTRLFYASNEIIHRYAKGQFESTQPKLVFCLPGIPMIRLVDFTEQLIRPGVPTLKECLSIACFHRPFEITFLSDEGLQLRFGKNPTERRAHKIIETLIEALPWIDEDGVQQMCECGKFDVDIDIH